MKDIEEEREIMRLQQERTLEESKVNPDILLSPNAMSQKVISKVNNFKEMFKEFSTKDDKVTEEMAEEIEYAMYRQEGLGIPLFKQDFAYRLIKLNQVNKTMWKTDFVKRVYKMVEDLDAAEEEMAAKGKKLGGNVGVGAKRRVSIKNSVRKEN